jgi:hypothetical protein
MWWGDVAFSPYRKASPGVDVPHSSLVTFSTGFQFLSTSISVVFDLIVTSG